MAVKPAPIKPATAKLIDLKTVLDPEPVPSREGPIVWATVTMEYTLAGLAPTVTISVPVPWLADETADERRAQALRAARQLIDHACRAAGIGPMEAADEPSESVIDAVTPPALEGLAQELGLGAKTPEDQRLFAPPRIAVSAGLRKETGETRSAQISS
jgi:hypothetical protein